MKPAIRVALVVFAVSLGGCAPITREHLFSGRQVTHLAEPSTGNLAEAGKPLSSRQSGEEISVQGWVVSSATSHALSLTFSNQSSVSVPMSAVVDEYTAKTSDGRAVTLSVGDFLNYPSALSPGDERTVTLSLPPELPADQITQVIAKLNQGQVIVALSAIGPKEPPAWRVGATQGIVVSRPAQTVRMEPAASVQAPIDVPKPVGPVAPRSEAPVGTVPVLVEFRQLLGSTLRAQIFWNESKDTVTLAPGEQQVFYVVPGQHELHVLCQVPFIARTHARVPVIVSATETIHVDLNAEAKMTGAQLRVKVWQGSRRVIDQTFDPLSH